MKNIYVHYIAGPYVGCRVSCTLQIPLMTLILSNRTYAKTFCTVFHVIRLKQLRSRPALRFCVGLYVAFSCDLFLERKRYSNESQRNTVPITGPYFQFCRTGYPGPQKYTVSQFGLRYRTTVKVLLFDSNFDRNLRKIGT